MQSELTVLVEAEVEVVQVELYGQRQELQIILTELLNRRAVQVERRGLITIVDLMMLAEAVEVVEVMVVSYTLSIKHLLRSVQLLLHEGQRERSVLEVEVVGVMDLTVQLGLQET